MKTATLGLLFSLLLRRATADPEYCSPHLKHTNRLTDSRLVPPIPCPGVYAIHRGICCAAKFDWLADRCHGHDHSPAWTLPLAPCVTANPFWSGCPGNMMDGLCCSGAELVGERVERGRFQAAQCQGGGTAVFSVTKLPGGGASTVTPPPGMSSVPPAYMVGVVVKPDGEKVPFTIGELERGHETTTTAPGAPLPTGGAAAPTNQVKKAGSAGMRADGGMVLMSGLAAAGAVLTVLLL
jgi:hypothetical protein